MSELIPVLNKTDIQISVSDLAQQISADYQDCEIVLIGILKGSFIFLSDLIRRITVPLKLDFLCVSSYGSKTNTSENIRLTKDIEIEIKDHDVLIVEDIIDTGLTAAFVADHLQNYGPRSLKICVLIDKHERRKADIKIDYAGRVVERGFLVGYGLDYAEQYRNLPEIYHFKL